LLLASSPWKTSCTAWLQNMTLRVTSSRRRNTSPHLTVGVFIAVVFVECNTDAARLPDGAVLRHALRTGVDPPIASPGSPTAPTAALHERRRARHPRHRRHLAQADDYDTPEKTKTTGRAEEWGKETNVPSPPPPPPPPPPPFPPPPPLPPSPTPKHPTNPGGDGVNASKGVATPTEEGEEQGVNATTPELSSPGGGDRGAGVGVRSTEASSGDGSSSRPFIVAVCVLGTVGAAWLMLSSSGAFAASGPHSSLAGLYKVNPVGPVYLEAVWCATLT
jgi:hypothetical protein